MRINIWVLVAIIMLSVIPAGVQAQSDEGLVAEWHFDEGSGNVVKDSSGNGNDGIIYGASWVDGKFGKALSFDGKDDSIKNVWNQAFNSELTRVIWFKSSGGVEEGILDYLNSQIQQVHPRIVLLLLMTQMGH